MICSKWSPGALTSSSNLGPLRFAVLIRASTSSETTRGCIESTSLRSTTTGAAEKLVASDKVLANSGAADLPTSPYTFSSERLLNQVIDIESCDRVVSLIRLLWTRLLFSDMLLTTAEGLGVLCRICDSMRPRVFCGPKKLGAASPYQPRILRA